MSKKTLNIILLLFGVSLFLLGLVFLRGETVKSLSGVCIGIGAGLFGMSISNLCLITFNKSHPVESKLSDIEFADERNTMIRNKAKAKAIDILQWFIMGIAYISILINSPLWVTMIVVGVFMLKHLLELYFVYKFQKEL